MKKSHMFFANLLANAFRYKLLFVISVAFMIVGAIWSDVFLYIGLSWLALYLAVCLASAIRMMCYLHRLSDEDSEIGELMSTLTADPSAFLDNIVGDSEKRDLHGEELLTLSDDSLFGTVYSQNLEIAEGAESEEQELDQFTGARRIVHILSLFDMEIQNGGLCQFFTNSSRTVAPYVSEALTVVGAFEHRALFDSFIAANGIDVSALSSFRVFSMRGYRRQTKRFDFDSFDDKYYDLPPLQEKVVAYIRNNINEF